ncbi:MAG: helix-turn-helix domain-containing protein [Eubacteriales bacterium]
MEDNKICETIRELRKRRGISQEILAQAFDVSVQAISKWETGNSLPDILLLPAISRFFGIKIDELFYGLPEPTDDVIPTAEGIKDDGVLRVVQFLGTRYLGHEEWVKDKYIQLDVKDIKQEFKVEIWGSADIKGNIQGDVDAGHSVNCGNVNSSVDAGHSVNCGNVNSSVDAGHSVNCGNVNGGVDAGHGVNCGNISGNVEAGGDIRCNEIEDVQSIECGKLIVKGNVKAGKIDGEVHHEGNIVIDF